MMRMPVKNDKIVTEEIVTKVSKTFREREDWWYLNDRDYDSQVEGLRDALNTVMPDIRKALFAEFQAAQDAKVNDGRKDYIPGE